MIILMIVIKNGGIIMYKELEGNFGKTVKLTKFLTYVFLFLSIVMGIYLIFTLSIPTQLFKISQKNYNYLLSFDKSFSFEFMVGEFISTKSQSEFKFIYSFIISNTLILVFLIYLILYNLLNFFKYSSLRKTPFNDVVIKYMDTIKWLIVTLAILPNITKSIFRYISTKQDIVVFDNISFLVPIFIALILNIMKYIFLYGVKLQDEYDSLV